MENDEYTHYCNCTAEDRKRDVYCVCEARVNGQFEDCKDCKMGCHRWKKNDA